MTFTEVFGGTTIYPSGVSYRAVALSADQTLAWPVETATSGNVVAQIMDITPSAGSLNIIMPPANEVSVGETTLFFNPGAFTFTVKDNGGNTIVAVAPGLSYQVYLIGNNTVNGTWRSTQYAAGTSSATAGSLVGAGIKAISTTLNQSMSVTTLNSNYAIGDADRSEAFVWTGGAGALTLPASGTVGNDWFCHIRNGGTGAITVTPTGSELINGSVNLTFNPGDSAIVICDGSSFFTIGFGQSASFAFDYVSIDLSSPVTSPYTLSGANLNRIAYSFGGALTANMQVYIPATIQQYWISNDTSGAFSLTVKVAGQVGVVIPQGSRGIYYCNGTDIIDADTASFAFPLTVAQGGTGATTESGARVNLGGTSVGIAVFTAVTAADGRNALIAAKSGANSDITSLSGLTTPLSVPQGGSGVATLTANGVVLGNGASALSATAVGTTGQVLVGNTGAAPSWATLTGIGVTSFSAGTTGLTPSTATTGAITLAGTLGVANGGTGTASVFPSGSVVFAGASGVYTHDNTKFFWDDTNDRLGIATASPTATLTANGTAKIGEGAASNTSKLMVNTLSGTSAGIQLIQDANESWIIQNPASTNVLTFGNSGTERMRITSGGDVGIGTAAPGSMLEIRDSGTGLGFTNSASGNFNIGLLAGTGSALAYVFQRANSSLIIGTNNTERMRIDSSGLVGIGTSSPATTLDIAVNGGMVRLAGTGGNNLIQTSTGSGSTGIGMWAGGDSRLYSTSGMILSVNSTLTTGAPSAYTDAIVINSSGNVGIGTGSPSYKLDVYGGASGTDTRLRIANAASNIFAGIFSDNTTFIGGTFAQPLLFLTNAAEAMRITSAGNVGIGTSSPSQRLDVTVSTATEGDGLAVTNLFTSGGSGGYGSGVNFYSVRGDGTTKLAAGAIRMFGSAAWADAASTSSNMRFYTVGANTLSERMRIDSSGNVGIGTSSPSYKLDVSGGDIRLATNGTYIRSVTSGGTIVRMLGINSGNTAYVGAIDSGPVDTIFNASSTSTVAMFYTGGSERMRIDSSGNVGIGTSSPGQKLEVNGITKINTASAVWEILQLVNTQASSGAYMQMVGAPGGTVAIGADAVTASTMIFRTAGTEKARIDTSGNLLVGTTVTTATQTGVKIVPALGGQVGYIDISHANGTADGNGYVAFFYNATTIGSITQSGTTAVLYNTSSDVRLKHDIIDAPEASSLIDAIQVRSFKWNADNSEQRYGFVAQELVTVAPEAVSQPADPDVMMGVDYSKLVPMLVKEIQSLRARVAQLEGN